MDVGNNIHAHQVVLGSLSEDLPVAIHLFEGKIQECLIKFAYTGQLDVEMTNIGSLHIEIRSKVLWTLVFNVALLTVSVSDLPIAESANQN